MKNIRKNFLKERNCLDALKRIKKWTTAQHLLFSLWNKSIVNKDFVEFFGRHYIIFTHADLFSHTMLGILLPKIPTSLF